MTFLNELMINEMEMPDLLPDVIPKERTPSGPPPEPDIEFEEDEYSKWNRDNPCFNLHLIRTINDKM